jgi:small subunit ribosomal protein S18
MRAITAKYDPDLFFDYRDTKTLARYLDPYGKIETREKTGLTAKQQRQLSVAIKRARHLGYLPFVIGE